VELVQGHCRFDVAPQQPGTALSIDTPSARVEVVGTVFAVSTRGGETEVAVEAGKVNFTRTADKKSIQLAGGSTPVSASTCSDELAVKRLVFVRGVNLGGRSIVIDGERWLSYADALTSGLSHGKLSVWNHPNFSARAPVTADMLNMLQSGVWTNESRGDDP